MYAVQRISFEVSFADFKSSIFSSMYILYAVNHFDDQIFSIPGVVQTHGHEYVLLGQE
jgi:hypothetical protein